MFNGNTNLSAANDGEDGIAIKDTGGLWYEMDMASTSRSGAAVKFTGAFSGVGITIAAGTDVKLGHNWVNAGLNFGAAGAELIANPSSWPGVGVPVLITETITIEWTITFST